MNVNQNRRFEWPKAQRTDIVCLADVAKESVCFLKMRTARETLEASKSSKLSYFNATYLLYQKVYQVRKTMLFLFGLLIWWRENVW